MIQLFSSFCVCVGYVQLRLLYFHYLPFSQFCLIIPIFVPISCANIGISFASHKYRMDSNEICTRYQCHQKMNGLHFGRNWTRDK